MRVRVGSAGRRLGKGDGKGDGKGLRAWDESVLGYTRDEVEAMDSIERREALAEVLHRVVDLLTAGCTAFGPCEGESQPLDRVQVAWLRYLRDGVQVIARAL